MFQRPEAYEPFPFAGVGQEAEQGRAEGGAVIHVPQMAELVGYHVVDERQGQLDELGGQRYLTAHGTASPAAFE